MAISHKNLAHSQSEYVRTYNNIKGVDFSIDRQDGDGRLPYIENMYRDYDSGSDCTIESVPGYRKIFSLGNKINAMYHHRASDDESYIVCHAGGELYRFPLDERDSGTTLSPIGELKNTRSSGFCYENDLCILDGEKITVVSKSGEVSGISADGVIKPYIPVTFIDSKENEQLNLLTDSYIERYVPTALSEITHESDGMTFEISDEKRKVCELVDLSHNHRGALFIPSTVRFGGELYTVESIGANAIANHTGVTALITNDNLTVIGANAFCGCTSLERVAIAPSVKDIRSKAFAGCDDLSVVYLGRGLEHISEDAFEGCTSLENIFYELSESDFLNVDGQEHYIDKMSYFKRYIPISVEFALHTPTREIKDVTVDGESHSYLIKRDSNGNIKAVVLNAVHRKFILGKTIEIHAVAKSDSFAKSEHGVDVRASFSGTLAEGGLINGCTKAALFDGRVFLSGNPAMKNTVFFSSRGKEAGLGEMYFGAYDYMHDGVGNHGVISMMAAQDTLFVFKSADDGDGGIFYHTPKATGDAVHPMSYPVSYAHSGVCSLGASAVFYDDPIFVSEIGICGFDKNDGTVGRDVVCRSHNVNPKLLSERLDELRMTVWRGYLVASIGAHIYLADSRQIFRHKTGGREYEWFFINDVGTPLSSSHVYRYHSLEYEVYYVHATPDEKVSDPARVATVPKDPEYKEFVYYAIENGKRYHAYITGEKTTYALATASDVLGVGELLFVGCTDGSVLVFNNDKRGVPPQRLTENDEKFDVDAYGSENEGRLHADFYDFAGVAPKYVIKTGWDSCDIPYLSKNTTRGSFSVKCKCWDYSRVACDAETDRAAFADTKGFAASRLSFHDLHFDSFSFNTSDSVTVSSRIDPKRWTEQQFTVYSETYRAPLGIYSISYRFKMNGRIK